MAHNKTIDLTTELNLLLLSRTLDFFDFFLCKHVCFFVCNFLIFFSRLLSEKLFSASKPGTP